MRTNQALEPTRFRAWLSLIVRLDKPLKTSMTHR